MLTRLVKMEFREDEIPVFLSNFESVKEKIRSFPGCQSLSLYQDKKNKNILFTYSHWNSEEHLENYRKSDLFKDVWKKTKPLFENKAEAWSVDLIHQLS